MFKGLKDFCSKYYPLLILFAYFIICGCYLAVYYIRVG